MGSGAILTEVIRAAEILATEGIHATVYSVTSWSELAREAIANDRAQSTNSLGKNKTAANQAYIREILSEGKGPIIAATDYVRLVPESIRAWIPEGRRYVTLGTDDFGRSDTRAALRGYFGVDAASIAQTARQALN